MKKGWENESFSNIIDNVKYTNKIKSQNYLLHGEFPIISQERELINGYWNNKNDVFKITSPVVIFGDHTKVVKYVDFNFVLGADGVKILQAKNKINAKYLYYFLLSIDLDNLGYARHYRLLKQIPIPVPPLTEQKAIVAILDKAFAAIDKARANIEKNIENARELFQSKLNEIFSPSIRASRYSGDGGEGRRAEPVEVWEEKTLVEISMEFGRGKSKHRPRNDKTLFGGSYPFIQTGDVRNSGKLIQEYTQTYNEKGLSQSKLWPKGTICITIAANIAETAILNFDSCFPDSIIGLVVNPKKANINFTYYCLQYFRTTLKNLGKGSAQDNINLGTFESQYFPFPDVIEQNKITEILDKILIKQNELISTYRSKLAALDELKKSILQKAFTGELTSTDSATADN